ncbi:MAG: molybdate ABC transporter substrate-binding protein [Myxococcota bacterium]|nr:molybdate ABC transporter substrate-binding protein [Myxococcota bacterium]
MFLLLIHALVGCRAPDSPSPLRIHAAASLSSVTPALLADFSADVTGEFNFASSSILARQLEHGIESDVYLSANLKWMDYIEGKDLIQSGLRSDHIQNQLVLIVPKGNPKINIADLDTESVHTVAMGDWHHVPAGIYAKEALESMNLWPTIQTKSIAAMDVRAAMTYVERKAVSVGIVYKTDALISNKVQISAAFPHENQPDIRYSVALLEKSTHPQALAFYRYLSSKRARAIFEKHGFVFQMQ